MEIFNKCAVILGIVGGVISSFLGGWDNLIIALITMIVLDYITGVIKAVYTKRLSSEIGYKGIVKKLLMLVIVALAVCISRVLPDGIMIREITIFFFIANEGVSILENAAEIITLPKQLKSILLQIRNKSEDTDINGKTGKNK
ncbi:MAG: holin family protein [Acutalibacteraceae bacterium]